MKRRDVSSWHIASVRCGAWFDRTRRLSGPVADIAEPTRLTHNGPCYPLCVIFRCSRCARNAFAEGRAGFFIRWINRGFGSFGRAIGMPGIERWIRIVLNTQLDALSHGVACDLGNNAEGKIDTRRDPARRDHIAVLDDPSLSYLAPTSGSSSAYAQWVVARRPLSNPATPRIKAPVHTEVTYFAVRDCR
jgi:hypothetical protein